jgi:sporulation protein YqfC
MVLPLSFRRVKDGYAPLLFFFFLSYKHINLQTKYAFCWSLTVGKKRNVKKDIVQAFGLAPEAVGSLRLIAIDNTDIVIENHGRVSEYTSVKVGINTGNLYITIEGEGLVLESLGAENLAIKGAVSAIRFDVGRRG